MTDAFEALDRFRKAVLADPAAQQALAAEEIGPRFSEAAEAFASARGIPLTADMLEMLRSLPERRLPLPEPSDRWPPRAWLPVRADPDEGVVDWCHFAGAPLSEPFFSESAFRARTRPFNQLVRWRTSLDSIVALAPDAEFTPTGLIFHMSRCGSTLVSRMLASVSRQTVLSEPPPLDAVIQRAARDGKLDDEQTVATVRAMAAALGRDRMGDARACFLKLDAWHAPAIFLFRRAFPRTPWVFLFRDPLEVLVSHARRPGMHAVPGLVESALLGIAPGGVPRPGSPYTAAILRGICSAAVAAAPLGGGLFLEYRELPDALFTRILPHFGVSPSSVEREAMVAASRLNAKDPGTAFLRDSEAKRREARDDIRAAAASLAEIHASLRALSA